MTRPAALRRTRLPADRRRAQVAVEAGRLFRLHGFHAVSMADVAGAVGITAPALYRHVAGKEELLVAAVSAALDAVDDALDRAPVAPLHDFVASVAEVAVAHRDLWVLLQRELRHVGPAARVPLDRRFADVVRRTTEAIAGADPGLPRAAARLLTVAVLAVLASPSTTHDDQHDDDHAALVGVLSAAALAAARTRWASTPAAPAQAPGAPGGRSEQVLDTAVRLFAARGYPAVSLDDIGAELGIAGPSIYHWYPTKADLLVAAFAGASTRLLGRRSGHGLDDLVEAYVRAGVEDHRFFALYVLEAKNLPAEAARRVRQALAADVAAWVVALARARPELSAEQATVLVHAARAVVQDVVRLGHWAEHPDTPAALHALVHAVLAAPLPGD